MSDFFLKLAIRFRLVEILLTSYIARKGVMHKSLLIRKLYKLKYKIDAGLWTYGCFTPEFNFGGLEIIVGRYCSIGSRVKFLGANHPINCFSTSAVFYNKAMGFNVPDVKRCRLCIEDDVWIGCNVLITAGCRRIGRGAIIGAGSVVTKDIEPYSIVGGVPAKLIRKRFSERRIEELEKSFWWNESPQNNLQIYKDEVYGKESH